VLEGKTGGWVVFSLGPAIIGPVMENGTLALQRCSSRTLLVPKLRLGNGHLGSSSFPNDGKLEFARLGFPSWSLGTSANQTGHFATAHNGRGLAWLKFLAVDTDFTPPSRPRESWNRRDSRHRRPDPAGLRCSPGRRTPPPRRVSSLPLTPEREAGCPRGGNRLFRVRTARIEPSPGVLIFLSESALNAENQARRMPCTRFTS
jgi:hypothetical protein